MKKLSSTLYNITRKTGKLASNLNDMETILTGDPKKIVKRFTRKNIRKAANNVVNKINHKI